jgi:hypothetical protein
MLSPLIDIVKAIRDAGDLAPFPYITVAASLALQVLQVIQVFVCCILHQLFPWFIPS